MSHALYRAKVPWVAIYNFLRAHGLPGLEEGMTWLDLDIDGTARYITKGRHINEAIERGTFVRVDIFQIDDLMSHLNDGDPQGDPPVAHTQLPLGGHLLLNFSNEDYHLEVVEEAIIENPGVFEIPDQATDAYTRAQQFRFS